ncbi:hypothetical protein LWI29_025934 [Acer saccharum]|uniref:Uncharacterized protein n=1 Tax=Acer saccharum TaxID=4024 RepID=A0AA39W735_ACESA|nr:hypothetical protein LWI29_025934 [Acer saccharum]
MLQTITLDDLRSSMRDMTLELQKFLRDDTWKETRKEVRNEKQPSWRTPTSAVDIRLKYGDGKAFQNGNNYVRNLEGDSTKGISGNKSQANNKNKNCSEGIINSVGGSRFDILSKDMDVVVDEGLPTGAIKMKGKSALVDITNLDSPNGKSGQWLKKNSRKIGTGDKLKTKLVTHQGAAGCSKGIKVAQGSLQVQKAADQDVAMEGQDSASILRHFHKEVVDFEDKCSKGKDDGLEQVIPEMYDVNQFEAVAASLEEAMASEEIGPDTLGFHKLHRIKPKRRVQKKLGYQKAEGPPRMDDPKGPTSILLGMS